MGLDKKWLLAEKAPEDFRERFAELPEIVAQLLWNRGLHTQEEVDEFLNPDYGADLHDPFLFRDMEAAVARIYKAIERGEQITIHGDYDSDGVCGSVILATTLEALGGKVDVFLPHRETDGYGLNPRTVTHLAQEGTNLIITCDNGISNKKEIEQAKELGIDTIVTDHHTVPTELPSAVAIIHPLVPGENYPCKNLAGGGVAFKLAQALIKKAYSLQLTAYSHLEPGFEKWLLDMAAISSVADMVPLVGETRTMVRYGIIVLRHARRLGIRKLIEAAAMEKEKIDTTAIGFYLAPRINAAGRMNHANAAYKLLMSKNEEEAGRLALELNQQNKDRQKLSEQILKEARAQIIDQEQVDEPALFAIGNNWPVGIVGLIAGKLADEFYRPAVVITLSSGEPTASVRSIPELNMMEAMQAVSKYFKKFGGHPMAGGFSLNSLDDMAEFKKEMRAFVGEKLKGVELSPKLKIDAEVELEDIHWELYDILEKFSPFGMSNPEPRYLAKGVKVVGTSPVGADGKHMRLMVAHKTNVIRKAIGFCFGEWCQKLKMGDIIDMVFEVGVNEWNGNRELQLKIVDLHKI
ncbi:single-stranded-DNA-specific exonuclease RecJ [Candidatus Uhrbacteria bacterium]|nr:single-stranded-DNA-specific exonuclease RecJ [Candidatus Uhrbacteria bacterium]